MFLDHKEVALPQGTVEDSRSLSTGDAKAASMTSDSASAMPSAVELPHQNGGAASKSPPSDIHPVMLAPTWHRQLTFLQQNFRSERDRRRADEREKSMKKRMLLNQARERMKHEASERARRE